MTSFEVRKAALAELVLHLWRNMDDGGIGFQIRLEPGRAVVVVEVNGVPQFVGEGEDFGEAWCAMADAIKEASPEQEKPQSKPALRLVSNSDDSRGLDSGQCV